MDAGAARADPRAGRERVEARVRLSARRRAQRPRAAPLLQRPQRLVPRRREDRRGDRVDVVPLPQRTTPGICPLNAHACLSTVHTDAQIGPPMLNVAATLGSFTCNSLGALPNSCCCAQPSMATPVAPTGWPLAMRPPDVL